MTVRMTTGLVILLLCLSSAAGGQTTCPPVGAVPAEMLQRLRPAMLVWSTGIDDPKGPERMIETVTAAVASGQAIWRVTHYPQDPSSTNTDDYDLYELDRVTLAPLRSVWRSGESQLEVRFCSGESTVRTGPGLELEKVAVNGIVAPERPGLTAPGCQPSASRRVCGSIPHHRPVGWTRLQPREEGHPVGCEAGMGEYRVGEERPLRAPDRAGRRVVSD
jgi:hypothetical protein